MTDEQLPQQLRIDTYDSGQVASTSRSQALHITNGYVYIKQNFDIYSQLTRITTSPFHKCSCTEMSDY